ncbi:MAG: guanylate kinase [Pseudomonadota bacterium]
MSDLAAPPGALFVISAPSGAGKTSLVKALIERHPNACTAVSYTTRAQRPREVHGKDYFFVEKDEFARLREADEFLEWAEVFGNHYGTSRTQVESLVREGHRVILEIDWQGARQVRQQMPESRLVFILPPSREELERRLRTRATDDESVIARRLSEAEGDMGHWAEFDYVIVNDDFERAVTQLCDVLDGKGADLRTDPAQPPSPVRHKAG